MRRAEQPAPALRKVVGPRTLRACVRRLAAEVARDHPDGEALVVVAVMKGALVFTADLMRRLPMPLEVELLNARSYRGTRRRRVRILDDVAALRVAGRRVLLVDCVLDSGHTLAAARDALAAQQPAGLATCVLLSKKRPREVHIQPEYVGMEIPDVFVVGYGLDHDNRWRHLPYVAEVAAIGEGGGHER